MINLLPPHPNCRTGTANGVPAGPDPRAYRLNGNPVGRSIDHSNPTNQKSHPGRTITLLFTLAIALFTTIPSAPAALFFDASATNELPVGSSREITVYLAANTNVSSAGITFHYDPADLFVNFVGLDYSSFGGPTQAVHMLRVETNRITFAVSRFAGDAYTAATNERIASLIITRLTNDAVTITTSESFTGKPGGNEFTPLALPPITLQATAEDTDGDGINDEWESFWFSNLDTADASTDFDGDGTLDIDHFLNDTNPRIPYLVSTPYLNAFTRSGPTRLALTFPTDSNALYRLQSQTSLLNQVWSDLVFSLTPSGVASAGSFTGTGTNTTLYLELPGNEAQFFRLELRE